jgi:hypothetical protein
MTRTVAVELVAVDAGQPRVRLLLPLVGQHEVDAAEGELGQGVLGLGLHELATQARRLARERRHGRHGDAQRGGLEGGDAAAPDHACRAGGQLGLGQLGAVEQRPGVVDQHQRGVGETHAAAGPHE